MVSIRSAMQGAYQPLPLREIVPSDGTHAATDSFGFRRNNGQASIASLNSHLVMRSNASLPLPCGNLHTPISLRTLHERSGTGGVETGTANSRGRYSSPCDRRRCFRHRSRHRLWSMDRSQRSRRRSISPSRSSSRTILSWRAIPTNWQCRRCWCPAPAAKPPSPNCQHRSDRCRSY